MNYETRVHPSETADGLALESQDKLAAQSQHQAEAAPARRRWLWLGLLLAGVAGVAGYVLSGRNAAPAGDGDEATLQVVTVATPGASTIQALINATGTLAARREMPVGVVGEGGRVLQVLVEPGDWVRQGQVLAVIDRSVQIQQAASQAAQIEVARADARLAQANLDRALQLVERGFISQADIDRLTATRDVAVARVRVAEAQLGERQARNAQLNIVAPAAGLVLTRNVEPGQVVGAGSGVLFSIARDGEMELRANLSEDDLARVGVGAVGSVTPVGLDRSFECRVWQVAPVIDAATRQGVVRCALGYAAELRPGGFASIRLNSGALVAPRLPESAVLTDDEGDYVFIVGPDNTVVKRRVRIGLITDEGIAIAEGLAGDELVVLRAGGFLSEGEKIRPLREGADR